MQAPVPVAADELTLEGRVAVLEDKLSELMDRLEAEGEEHDQ